MKTHEYENYEDYVKWQTKINKLKLKWVYVKEHAIEKIVLDYGQQATFIICHGTRNGAEQKMFKERFPNAYIIGTEISDTANQFEMTVQHDFTIPRKEWIGKADLIYSNSIDHSINPQKTLETWKNQLKANGTLYIEYNQGQARESTEADPLSATLEEMLELVKSAGMDFKVIPRGSQGSDIIVCQNGEQND